MKVGDLVSMIGRKDTIGFVIEIFSSTENIEALRRDMIRILTDGAIHVYLANYFEVISESR